MIEYSQLFLFKYAFKNVLLKCTKWDSPKSIPSNDIMSISIVNKYKDNVVPEIIMTCLVDYNTYYDILSYAKNLEVSLGIYSNESLSYLNQNNNADLEVYSTEWVKCDFKATDVGYLYTKDVSENGLDRQSLSPNFNQETQNQKREIKLYLYDSNKLIKYRRNLSGVINGSLNDVMFHLLNERGFNDVLMTPIDDVNKLDYAVPFGDLGQNLESLNHSYGLYNTDYVFYMGLDRTYLCDYANAGNVVESNELGTVNIYIEGMDDTNNASMTAGCYKDATNNIYVIASSDVTIDNIDTLQDFGAGGKITSSIAGTKDRHSDVVGEYDIEKSHMFSNDKERKQFLYNMKEAKRIIYITCNNVDLRIITPNKKFKVISNKNYYDETYDLDGDYRLITSTISLVNNGENQLTNSVTLSLARMVED